MQNSSLTNEELGRLAGLVESTAVSPFEIRLAMPALISAARRANELEQELAGRTVLNWPQYRLAQERISELETTCAELESELSAAKYELSQAGIARCPMCLTHHYVDGGCRVCMAEEAEQRARREVTELRAALAARTGEQS